MDTVLESPVRTMRVNVIGTYNVLEAGAGDEGHARAARRLLDERGLRLAGLSRRRDEPERDRLGRRGALDVRGLEARGRAHGARLPRRARPADDLGAPVQRLRARADGRRRDPRVHRGGARRAGPDDPRRRLADPRLVLRRRHGRRRRCSRSSIRTPSARASTSATHAPRSRSTTSRSASSARPRRRARSSSGPSTTPTSSCASRTSTRRRNLLGFESQVELDEGLARTVAWYRSRALTGSK